MVIGSKTYLLLRNLVAPTLPQTKSLDDLVAVLKKHFKPKPLVIAEHFCFHQHTQAVPDNMGNSPPTEFGDPLDEALRERLVCGITDMGIHTQGAEAATNAKSLKGGHTVATEWYRCGMSNRDTS